MKLLSFISFLTQQPMREAKEFILWGVPKGKKDQLYAVVLYTQGKNKADIDRITKLAAKDGWHSFRTQIIDMDEPFDAKAAFAGAIKKKI